MLQNFALFYAYYACALTLHGDQSSLYTPRRNRFRNGWELFYDNFISRFVEWYLIFTLSRLHKQIQNDASTFIKMHMLRWKALLCTWSEVSMAESVTRSPTDLEVRGSNPALDILRIKFLDFAKSSGRSRTINGLWCRWWRKSVISGGSGWKSHRGCLNKYLTRLQETTVTENVVQICLSDVRRAIVLDRTVMTHSLIAATEDGNTSLMAFFTPPLTRIPSLPSRHGELQWLSVRRGSEKGLAG